MLRLAYTNVELNINYQIVASLHVSPYLPTCIHIRFFVAICSLSHVITVRFLITCLLFDLLQTLRHSPAAGEPHRASSLLRDIWVGIPAGKQTALHVMRALGRHVYSKAKVSDLRVESCLCVVSLNTFLYLWNHHHFCLRKSSFCPDTFDWCSMLEVVSNYYFKRM